MPDHIKLHDASKSEPECRIIVKNATKDDNGNWTCTLKDPKGIDDPVSDIVLVEVRHQKYK